MPHRFIEFSPWVFGQMTLGEVSWLQEHVAEEVFHFLEDREQRERKRTKIRHMVLRHSCSDLLSAAQLSSLAQCFPGLPRVVILTGDKHPHKQWLGILQSNHNR